MKLKMPRLFKHRHRHRQHLDDHDDDDDEALMDATGFQLSADAKPFHPRNEPVNIAIYNEGVPCMSLRSEADRAKILHGIEDEAIDEGFPPDAEDAAELEAAEEWVMDMATFALMEEREEEARTGFVHIKKRWEARRVEGPTGRPRPAMHLIVPIDHCSKHKNVKTIVPYAQMHRLMMREEKMRMHEIKHRIEPRHIKTTAMQRMPIQQPRKYY